MPRLHKYGETTSSPTSKSECDCHPTPPESSRIVLPSGVIISSESPYPTSIAATSTTPGRHSFVGGATVIQMADASRPATPIQASSNRRRARIIAAP